MPERAYRRFGRLSRGATANTTAPTTADMMGPMSAPNLSTNNDSTALSAK